MYVYGWAAFKLYWFISVFNIFSFPCETIPDSPFSSKKKKMFNIWSNITFIVYTMPYSRILSSFFVRAHCCPLLNLTTLFAYPFLPCSAFLHDYYHHSLSPFYSSLLPISFRCSELQSLATERTIVTKYLVDGLSHSLDDGFYMSPDLEASL